MSARRAWIAAAALALLVVSSDGAAAAAPVVAAKTTAASCISGVSITNTVNTLSDCFWSVTANLSVRGLIHGNNLSVPVNVIDAIGAIEPQALNYWAAFTARWPLMFDGALLSFPQFNWTNVRSMFALHCSAVAGPFSDCAVAAAAPLCPTDKAKVKALMGAWAGRYCNVTYKVPRANVIARLQSDFNSSMNVLSCTVNSTRSSANFRNDIGNLLNYISSECMDLTAFGTWAMQFTNPAIMNADLFSLANTVRPIATSLLRCGMRAYNRYCPGALNSNWATLSYAITLMLSNLLGANLTPTDLSWNQPAANVSAGAPHSVAGSFDGRLLSFAAPQWVQCATSSGMTELLLANQYSTVTRTPTANGAATGQSVLVTFDDTTSGSRVRVGSYSLSAVGASTVVSMLADAKGVAAKQLSVGGRVAVTLSGPANGVYTLVDSRSTTTYRLYGKSGKVAVVVNAPNPLLSRSFGMLPQGCLVTIPGQSLTAPKQACLAASKCVVNKSCTAADCAAVASYRASGWASVVAATKF